jgi:uncharacterized protein YjiK
MKNHLKPVSFCFILITCLLFIKCTGQQKIRSPKGYDLNKPVKYNMPDNLTEISGIAFNKGNPDTIFAEQDEEGELFYFKPGNKNVQHIKFGKSGDYEDVAISNNQVIMLRSDGVLFTFPLDLKTTEVTNAKEWNNLLPQGEYEGMYADESDQSVYVLCKHCSIEKSSKICTVFNFKLSDDGSLKSIGQNTIDVKKIEELTGKKKIAFHPSALSKNPQTNEWYILSSVNKLLVIADTNWNVKDVFPLNSGLFGQPEGIAFDKENNLYISNEGDKLRPGNILKFIKL